jgi:thiosulfate/3-mercaptopyruvate sulfurtransferase
MIRTRLHWGANLLALLIILNVLASNSIAEPVCTTCGGATQNWDKTARDFITGNSTEETLSSQSTPQLSRSSSLNSESTAPQRSSSFDDVLAPIPSVIPSADASSAKAAASGYDVILDVSSDANEYIKGAISIPYSRFIGETSLKPVSEVAKILGDAGISENDSVLVYGQCLPCGVNSAYVYWIFKYLGHDKVKILDGGIDDWVAAKLPTDTVPNILHKTNYTPKLRPELLATYDYVKNGQVQIVDARTFEQYGMGSIPNSKKIPYNLVMSNGRMKGEEDLKDLFIGLNKTKPVVVYTANGAQAAGVWLALELVGYNASLYSWRDWLENQPQLDIELEEIHADPNPATSGTPIRITALFGEANKKVAAEPLRSNESNENNNTSNQTILTTKGCVTCGFGSPQGFANINKSSGIAQLGNSGKSQSKADTFACSATIRDLAGSDKGQINMKQISGDQYSGIWNANVGPGVYRATIVASAGGATKTFEDVLDIEVIGSSKNTSKYKKVGN